MLTFEKFRFRAFNRRAYYDIFNAGVLFALALMVLPGWDMMGGGSSIDVVAMMTSPRLLAAMGMMLAWRYGTADLSIWAVMGMGGLIAAEMLNLGCDPYVSFLAAALAGAVIGFINFILVKYIRIYSWIITFAVGCIIIGVLNLIYSVREVAVNHDTFDKLVNDVMWLLNANPNSETELVAPMLTMRMLVVFSIWAIVLTVLLISDMITAKTPRPFARWWVRPLGLIASGALSAIAGACWLLDSGETPVPTRPIDNLYIPTAVILSGAIFLTGRGRTLLVSICLPTAMLVVLMWNQVTWPFSKFGFSLEMLTLMVMIGLVQWTFIWAMDYPINIAWIGWLVLAICLSGLSVLALTPWLVDWFDRRTLYFMGTGIWAVGAAAFVTSILMISNKRAKTDYD